MSVEVNFLAELKIIESSIMDVFRARPTLLDSQVARAVSAMITVQKAKIKGKPYQEPKLSDFDLLVFHALDNAMDKISCSDADALSCLKKIEKSIATWTKQLGRQGYLTFVSNYV